MILENQLTSIGHLVKPHGINGEISMTLESDIDVLSLKCIILNLDGLFVPFFIESCRAKGSSSILITIDGVTNENMAADICNKTVYALSDECIQDLIYDEPGVYATDLIGFVIYDCETEIGEIIDIEDSTDNALFIVQSSQNIIYIPIADEMIEEIDIEHQKITMNLPTGILEL